jgi:hypothetical protein
LGNLERGKIEQIGEQLARHQQDFRVLEDFAYLKKEIA